MARPSASAGFQQLFTTSNSTDHYMEHIKNIQEVVSECEKFARMSLIPGPPLSRGNHGRILMSGGVRAAGRMSSSAARGYQLWPRKRGRQQPRLGGLGDRVAEQVAAGLVVQFGLERVALLEGLGAGGGRRPQCRPASAAGSAGYGMRRSPARRSRPSPEGERDRPCRGPFPATGAKTIHGRGVEFLPHEVGEECTRLISTA